MFYVLGLIVAYGKKNGRKPAEMLFKYCLSGKEFLLFLVHPGTIQLE